MFIKGSPHTPLVRDIVFKSWGKIVIIKSSKTIQHGKDHQIPVSTVKNRALWAKSICSIYIYHVQMNYLVYLLFTS